MFQNLPFVINMSHADSDEGSPLKNDSWTPIDLLLLQKNVHRTMLFSFKPFTLSILQFLAAYRGLPIGRCPKDCILLIYKMKKMCAIPNMQSCIHACMYMYDNLVDMFCFIELTATYCHLFWTHYYFPIRHDRQITMHYFISRLLMCLHIDQVQTCWK